MRIIQLYVCLLLFTGCSFVDTIIGRVKAPQPKCDPTIEYVIPTGRIAITGDGDGMDKALDVLTTMVKTCPDCVARFDAGDVYETGIHNEGEWTDKIVVGDRLAPFPTFRTLGNHSYVGDVQMQVDLTKQCYQFAVTDRKTFWMMSVDTNHKTPEQINLAREYLCNKPGLRILLHHHPLYASSVKDRDKEEAETREWLQQFVLDCVDLDISGHAHHQEVMHRRVQHVSGMQSDSMFLHVQGALGRSLRDIVKDEGQLFAVKRHGFSILDGRMLTLYGDDGRPLRAPFEVPKKATGNTE